MSEDSTYNGWKNYATWGVALVLDNDEGTYNECREQAQQFVDGAGETSQVRECIWTKEQAARYNFADWVKDYVDVLCGLDNEYGVPEPSLMARQVIQAGLAEVDWDEVADHYLSELAEA